MARTQPWTDECTLLCERCGYVLEGIGGEKCPECGKPVEESLPVKRRGSPWQLARNLRGWLQTWWMLHTHPWRIWRECTVSSAKSDGLLMANLITTAAFTGVVYVVIARRLVGRGSGTAMQEITTNFFACFACALAVLALLAVLTAIEAFGVQFFGRRRGWRITREVAWTICSHASGAWIWAVIGWQIGVLLWPEFEMWLIRHLGRWSFSPDAFVVPALIGFMIGMLAFETLVYIGVRECKFANRSRQERE